MVTASDKAGVQLARVGLAVFDVDGVLTDGGLFYSGDGEALKRFDARDGLGLKLLMFAGVEVGVISARRSSALERRLAELGIKHVWLGCSAKRDALVAMADKLGVPLDATAFMGDDLIDIPALQAVGVPLAVQNAHPLVQQQAVWVSAAAGGDGAVRELCEAIITARRGGFASFVQEYLSVRTKQQPASFSIVIPARYASSRLPGKPLVDLDGKTMIERTHERALEAAAAHVVVATDDSRVLDAVHAFGGDAMMTSDAHPSGTDRLFEVVTRKEWSDDHIVVNLQGDEPLIPPQLLAAVAGALAADPGVGMSTVATPILEAHDLFDENVVKVVLDARSRARYFSRAPIPWVRGLFAASPRPASLPSDVPFLRHVGLYAYRVGTLRRLASAEPSPLEGPEALEQLRALGLGVEIHTTVVKEPPGHGVDVPEDVDRVVNILRKSASDRGDVD